MLDVAIIGGGLSGLSLARQLQGTNRTFKVFESRDRFGGRILSVPASHCKNDTAATFRCDLGPGWIWPEFQPRLAAFIEQNHIEVYPQWTSGKSLYQTDRQQPPQAYFDHDTYGSARRVNGGTYRLVGKLLQQLPQDSLVLKHQLLEINDAQDHIELCFNNNSSPVTITARQVVITIPPRLLINSVTFKPALDSRLYELMHNTITWMAGHAKAVIYYPHAFWRDAGFSGNALATYQGAALAEIFDACSPDGQVSALSGFLALPAELRAKYRGDLNALIIEQLVRLFGKEAAHPDEIHIKDWFEDSLTATQADEFPPGSHPEYGHAWLQLDHWNDKLYFGGTETAAQFGGYLEGALESAEHVANRLLL
ncbi:flavin monoamine oxidase family protein [Kaarinaea lacus]